ncbi:MAG: hemin-degrading factor [Bacteroidetes bacterium]|nr:hemin-degrading factor [Bacteroidota bacterium]
MMKNTLTLKQQAVELKTNEPRLRNLDLAQRLGISEAEFLSLYAGEHVTLLEGDWKELLPKLNGMGYVMALTRNEHCVHERKGVYDNLEFYGGPHNMGVAVNPDIDLRFFMNEWKYGMAVEMDRGKMGILYSFQFFNKKGEAVHKVFSTPDSNLEVYHALVKEYQSNDQTPLSDVDHSPYEIKTPLSDEEIDVEGFQEAWKNLKDTHDFFGMLRKFNVTRTQGLRLAPEGFTHKIDNEAVVRTLETAAQREVSIMCFLHSRGCVQIHTGEVKNLKFFGDWYNVMDPKFNLHLNMPGIKETWVVKKPTDDGIVTSIELFDENGELIVYFFGARKPGIPELESWREIVASVEESVPA